MRHFHPSNLFMSVYIPTHQCRLLEEYLVMQSLGIIQRHIIARRIRKYFEVRINTYIIYYTLRCNLLFVICSLANHFIFKDSFESHYVLYIVFEDIKTNISCVYETRRRFTYRISQNISLPMQ